jgi:hypothetical protein
LVTDVLFTAKASKSNEAYKYITRKPEKQAEKEVVTRFSWRKAVKTGAFGRLQKHFYE